MAETALLVNPSRRRRRRNPMLVANPRRRQRRSFSASGRPGMGSRLGGVGAFVILRALARWAYVEFGEDRERPARRAKWGKKIEPIFTGAAGIGGYLLASNARGWWAQAGEGLSLGALGVGGSRLTDRWNEDDAPGAPGGARGLAALNAVLVERSREMSGLAAGDDDELGDQDFEQAGDEALEGDDNDLEADEDLL